MFEAKERLKEYERLMLCEKAASSFASKGRERPEEPDEIRTDFQRDRDRILHSNAFRRLKHKTQVFLSPAGDHYRTRLTHTLEVSQIARTISRGLLLNEDLTEAIALGHDLGHTPFGHAGERTLNELNPDGFHHYEQSLRVVDIIEKNGEGLNLTWEVRDGILKHTNMTAETLEGCVVRKADVIAYINHDIDDSIRAGILTEEDIPKKIRDVLGTSKSQRIASLVKDVVAHGNEEIGMSPVIEEAFNDLHKFMFDFVYFNPKCKSEEVKAKAMIEKLYEYYQSHIEKLPAEYMNLAYNYGADRAICDYIAGMTDGFATEAFKELYIPKGWTEY